MRLYEITENYRQALDAMLADEDLPADAVKDTLNGILGEFDEKAVAVGAYIKELEAEAAAQKEAAKGIADRAKRTATKATRIKEYLFGEMKRVDRKRINSPQITIRIAKNPVSVNIADERAVPDEFRHPAKDPEPDKAKIKKALIEQEETPGSARLNFAVLVRDSERLEIK